MVIEGLLGPLGYVLTSAMDGDDALELLKTRDYLPDLVLLDVQMFEKTGYDVRTVAFHSKVATHSKVGLFSGLAGMPAIKERLPDRPAHHHDQ